jgi:ribosomal protein S4E
MLDKLGGVFAPRPSPGPHKLRESLPLVVMLRNRLKYALTRNEVTKIVMQRSIKVDGKVRTDINYPAGFMGKKIVMMSMKVWPFRHRRHSHYIIVIDAQNGA